MQLFVINGQTNDTVDADDVSNLDSITRSVIALDIDPFFLRTAFLGLRLEC